SVETWIKNIFLTYKIDKLRISRLRLLTYINETKKYKIDEEKLKYYLERKRGIKYKKTGRCKIPTHFIKIYEDNTPHINYQEEIQRHYEFLPEEWLSENELKEYRSPWHFEEVETEVSDALAGEFVEAEKLDDKQYKQEELWQEKKGPAPF